MLPSLIPMIIVTSGTMLASNKLVKAKWQYYENFSNQQPGDQPLALISRKTYNMEPFLGLSGINAAKLLEMK